MVSDAGFPALRRQRDDRRALEADHPGPAARPAAATAASRSPTHWAPRPATTRRPPGVLAAEAGADILLFTDSAPGELAALERSFARGAISRAAADASYQRIVALKRKVAG